MKLSELSEAQKRIGLFGGTFNPVHIGHCIVAEHAADELDLDMVLFIPCKVPPHKSPEELAPPLARLEMVQLAIANNPRFKACPIELERAKTPSYSIDTVRDLRERYPHDELFFLTGGDQYAELASWKDIHELLELCQFVFLSRPGTSARNIEKLTAGFSADEIERLQRHWLDVPEIEISSRGIRRRVRQGLSIRYLVPDAVRHYIVEHKLYGGKPQPNRAFVRKCLGDQMHEGGEPT